MRSKVTQGVIAGHGVERLPDLDAGIVTYNVSPEDPR
jgi:hypothetical protein